MKKTPWQAHQSIGLLVALFGAILVFRWILNDATITRLIPGAAAMELNAPLLLLTAGICCVFYPERDHYAAPLKILLRLCGWLVLILPLLQLLQHLFGINLGINFVRLPVVPTEGRPHPGRLSPQAALAFLSVGSALFLLRRKRDDIRYYRIVLTLILVPMLIGLTGLAGHFLQLETFYHLPKYNQMTVPTALGISLLSYGVWLLQQSILSHHQLKTRQYWERATRRAIATLVIVALAGGIAGFAVMRDAFEDALAESIRLSVTSNVAALGNMLENKLALHRTIGANPGLRRNLIQLQKQPHDKAARASVAEHIAYLSAVGLDGVRLYDAGGRLVAAAGGAMLHDQAALAHRLSRAEQTAYLVWQDGYLLHTENKLIAEGHTVGTIVVEQRLPDFDKLLHDLQVSHASADALLCSRDNNAAICAPSRLTDAVTSMPLPGPPGIATPIELALLGQSGIVTTRDARQNRIFAAYAPLQEFGLGLVITMDLETLYAPLRQKIQLLAAALIILVAFGTLTLRLAVRPLLQRLSDSQRRLRAITDNVPVLITYIDPEYKIGFCNHTFEEWFGTPASDVLGKPVNAAIGPFNFAQREKYMERALAGERVEFEVSSDTNGVRRHLQNTYVPDITSDGTVAGIYTLSMDITAAKDVQQRLQQMARFDALTGLPNRYLMNEKLHEAIMRCHRSGEPMAIMFLDVDHFKLINDSLGHAGGDEVLKEFGRRLKASVRQTDTACRLAGDEFVIIFEKIGSPDAAETIASKIIANVEAPFAVEGHPVQIGTSIGIAYCQNPPQSPASLISQADQALYEAKEAGRGTYRLVCC
ncbi:PAS domain S-box-containing protein/diguanylate cyclase (GGDEF)-like protein [Paucimonas lemoignei]|uniref:PAS domain S-box-containing protein/diguanylate cyclase (GGDEF)-like protein n=1 Tax=Paucimonas lemoignei TaxID=29443 RepID=A0A4R3HX73_PAULE|nr:GGDEF domain-containing protein [Paucimonas lemoignei]TCS37414.1 PAS domain S-box-containing protein/diguanylate cyclase (GGDEF)-like protein [Paucimonas lemoignei]